MPAKSPLDRFPLAPSLATPRLLATSYGDVGTGKTRFALTGPAPVVVFSLDDGTEGVVEEFRTEEDKEIRVVRIDWTPADDDDTDELQQLAVTLRDQYITDLKLALQYARTVVVDKETDLWNMFRYSYFGAPKADVPRDFDRVNQMMRKYLQLPKKHGVNFLALQSVKDEWVSQSKKSGAQKRAGFQETPGLMSVDLLHTREHGIFSTTVMKARGPGAKDVQDKTFSNLDIPTLGMMLFPDSDDTAWV